MFMNSPDAWWQGGCTVCQEAVSVIPPPAQASHSRVPVRAANQGRDRSPGERRRSGSNQDPEGSGPSGQAVVQWVPSDTAGLGRRNHTRHQRTKACCPRLVRPFGILPLGGRGVVDHRLSRCVLLHLGTTAAQSSPIRFPTATLASEPARGPLSHRGPGSGLWSSCRGKAGEKQPRRFSGLCWRRATVDWLRRGSRGCGASL